MHVGLIVIILAQKGLPVKPVVTRVILRIKFELPMNYCVDLRLWPSVIRKSQRRQ